VFKENGGTVSVLDADFYKRIIKEFAK